MPCPHARKSVIAGTGLAAVVATILVAIGWPPRWEQPAHSPPATPGPVPEPRTSLGGVAGPTTVAANVDELARQLATGRAVIAGLAFIGTTDTLNPSSDAVVTSIARALTSMPGIFLIEAHVPPSGEVLAEHSLTDRRATALRTRLVAAGVPATRLVAMGFGATRTPTPSMKARIEMSRMP